VKKVFAHRGALWGELRFCGEECSLGPASFSGTWLYLRKEGLGDLADLVEASNRMARYKGHCGGVDVEISPCGSGLELYAPDRAGELRLVFTIPWGSVEDFVETLRVPT